jgi:uncharacterized Zn-finger protein
VNKVDHAIGYLALEWLQWGDKWDEERAQVALTYMSQLKAAVNSQDAALYCNNTTCKAAHEHPNVWCDYVITEHQNEVNAKLAKAAALIAELEECIEELPSCDCGDMGCDSRCQRHYKRKALAALTKYRESK